MKGDFTLVILGLVFLGIAWCITYRESLILFFTALVNFGKHVRSKLTFGDGIVVGFSCAALLTCWVIS